MESRRISDFALYKWRYKLSYLGLILLACTLLFISGVLIPGGVSTQEQTSVVRGAHSTLSALKGQNPEFILHLPYRLLQNAILSLFGISTFTIKAASLLLAAASLIFLYGLLRLWFRPNVAIITTIITMTLGQFLLQSQSGTPAISYIFWSTALLFSASMLSQAKKFRSVWLVITGLIAGLAVYSPLEIYIVLALTATVFLHPHARFIVFRQPKLLLLASAVGFTALITPLIFGLFYKPATILSLLGLPPNIYDFSWSEAGARLLNYVNFPSASAGTTLTPILNLGVVLLALVGLYRLFTTKYTAKSYILTIWLILLIPAIVFTRSAIGLVIVPAALLVAFAFDYLIRTWYRMFPLNPYARAAGLLPLGVLMMTLSVSNLDRYAYGYHYDPTASSVYTSDVSLMNKALANYRNKPVSLIVDKNDVEFYKLLANKASANVIVSSSGNELFEPSPSRTIIASASYAASTKRVPSNIVVSEVSSHANRFYIYESSTN